MNSTTCKKLAKYYNWAILTVICILIPSSALWFDINLYSCFDLSKASSIYYVTICLVVLWLMRVILIKGVSLVTGPMIIPGINTILYLMIGLIVSLAFLTPIWALKDVRHSLELSKINLLHLVTIGVFSLIIIWIVCLVKRFRVEKPKFVGAYLNLPVMATLFVVLLSMLFSINPWMSYVGTYKRYEGLAVILCYILGFYAIVTFINTKQRLYGTINVTILAGLLVSIYGMMQRHGLDPCRWEGFSRDRIISSFGNPVFAAAFVIMTFPLALGMYILYYEKMQQGLKPPPTQASKKKKRKDIIQKTSNTNLINIIYTWIYGIIVVGIYYCFTLVNTRACYIGLFFAMVVFAIMVGIKRIKENKVPLGIVGVFIFLIFAYYNFINEPTSVLPRLKPLIFPPPATHYQIATGTTQLDVVTIDICGIERKSPQTPFEKITDFLSRRSYRGYIWTANMKILQEHPWLGVGQDTMGIVFPRYLDKVYPKSRLGPIEYEDRSHQDFLDIGAARGFLGIIMYLWLLGMYLWITVKFYKSADKEGKLIITSLLTAVIAYFCQNQFSFAVTPLSSLFWILLGMTMVAGVHYSPSGATIGWINIQVVTPRIKDPIMYTIICLSIVIIGIILFSVVGRPYKADRLYKDATVWLARDDLDMSIKTLEEAISIYPYEIRYYDELERRYIDKTRRVEQVDQKEALKYIEKTITSANNALKLVRGHSPAYFTLGLAYFIKGYLEGTNTTQQALTAYRKSEEGNPFSPDVYNNMAVIYSDIGDLDKTVEQYKKSIRLDSDNLRCYSSLGRVYIRRQKAGDLSKARIVFEELYRRDPTTETQQILAYLSFKEGDVNKSIAKFEELVRTNPDNIVNMENLVNLYVQNKRFLEAKELLNRILSIIPSGTPDYIKNKMKLDDIERRRR